MKSRSLLRDRPFCKCLVLFFWLFRMAFCEFFGILHGQAFWVLPSGHFFLEAEDAVSPVYAFMNYCRLNFEKISSVVSSRTEVAVTVTR